VGGGPDPEYNQAAIEGNVRYVSRILPRSTSRTTLFADGNPRRATVLAYETAFVAAQGDHPQGDYLLQMVLAEDAGTQRYRMPRLETLLDGPATRPGIEKAFAQLSRAPGKSPLLLYFTGHGSENTDNQANNFYNLWGADNLSVRDLSQQIARLPATAPITVIMVQCYSGAFGNLLFKNGDPRAGLVERDIVGFFASTPRRMAAGCTADVNEAEYHDFTSYFFAALVGRDRVGRRVTGADYNRDGRVGMDEAFYYTLTHDKSIDVPVSTSDVFLRHFVTLPETQTAQISYLTLRGWATSAQRAALDALSQRAGLTGNNRLQEARDQLARTSSIGSGLESWRGLYRYGQSYERYETTRKAARAKLIERWPALTAPGSAGYAQARQAAVAQLTRDEKDGLLKDLLDARRQVQSSYDTAQATELRQAYTLRFLRLGHSIALAQELRRKGPSNVVARFNRLLAGESKSLIPPVR